MLLFTVNCVKWNWQIFPNVGLILKPRVTREHWRWGIHCTCIFESREVLQWGAKVLRHLAVNFDFEHVENISLFPFQTMFIFLFLDCADYIPYTTSNWRARVLTIEVIEKSIILKVSQLFLLHISSCMYIYTTFTCTCKITCNTNSLIVYCIDQRKDLVPNKGCSTFRTPNFSTEQAPGFSVFRAWFMPSKRFTNQTESCRRRWQSSVHHVSRCSRFLIREFKQIAMAGANAAARSTFPLRWDTTHVVGRIQP